MPNNNNENRIFTQEELQNLPRYRPWLIRDLLEEGKLDKAKETFVNLNNSIGFLHDGAFTWIAGLMTYVYNGYGNEGLDEAYRFALKMERLDIFPKSPFPDFDLIVTNFARDLRGICKQKFSITEDEEKVIFSLKPCGNGGRLIDMAYEPDAGIARCEESSPLSFGEPNLPIFCSGCAMREIRDFEETGHLQTVRASDAICATKTHDCKIFIYKDPDDVPVSYYERLGLKKPEPTKFSAVKPARFFSDEQLNRLGAMPEDAVINEFEKESNSNIMEVFDRYYEEKTRMHDAVSCMCGALLTWIYEKENFDGVVAAEMFAHKIEAEIAMPHDNEDNLRDLILGTLNALHGHVHQNMKMTEDDKKIVLEANPCGSGGRMIQRAYDPDIGYARLKGNHPAIWNMDELPIYCIHCPLFEQMAVDNSGSFAAVHSFHSTESPKSPVCEYVFYKNPADIPEEYFNRIGRKKP